MATLWEEAPTAHQSYHFAIFVTPTPTAEVIFHSLVMLSFKNEEAGCCSYY